MGAAYATAVGAMPNPASKAWLNFVGRLINYRLAECPLARTTTYYFSTSGSDANSGLTPALPKLSVSAANTLLQTPNTRVRFRRDDIFRFVIAGASPNQHLQNASINAGGIVIGAAHCTVDSYTDEAATGTTRTRPPIFTPFIVLANGSWTLDGVLTNSYKITVAAATGATNNVAAFRETLSVDPDRIFVRVGSSATVNTTPGSFYYDAAATTLWMRPFLGAPDPTAGWHPGYEYLPQFKASDLATITYDSIAAYKDCGPGCLVTDFDDVRIDGLRFDGFLASFNDTNSNTWWYAPAVEVEHSGTNAALVTNCEGYYSGSHTFFQGGQHGTGAGIFTCMNCRAGMMLAVDVANGRQCQDQFMSYHPSGGNEGLFVDCVSVAGRLPSSTYNDATLQGAMFQTHSDSANNHQPSLQLRVGCEIQQGQWQVGSIGLDGDMPNWITGNITGAGVTATPGDMSQCRAFHLGGKYPVRLQTNLDTSWWSGTAPITWGMVVPSIASNTIHINCDLDTRAIRSSTTTGGTPFTGNGRPSMINCIWNVDLTLVKADIMTLGFDTNPARYYFSRIRIQHGGHSGAGAIPPFALNAAYAGNNVWASAGQAVKAKGCIFEMVGSQAYNTVCYAGITNNLNSGGTAVASGSENEHTNAYVGGWTSKGTATDYWGFSNCPNFVTAPRVEMFPQPASVLVVASLPTIETVALEYDKLCNDRNPAQATIGPVTAIDGVKRFSAQFAGGIFKL